MSQHLVRALMLLEQSRQQLALEELQLHLAEFPEDAYAHAVGAQCLLALERYDEATQAAQQAIQLSPDLSIGHQTLACVWYARGRYAEAQAAIDEAIRLNPDDPDHFALLAQVSLARRKWTEALEAAERGLELDAEHELCNNLRALALVRLGRRDQAGQTIDAVLARNPEDAFTHANQGWTLLNQRQPQKALVHFRESLRIDPTCDWAREGIVESLKARNFLYRWMLAWFFWMGHLPVKWQFAILIFGVMGYSSLTKFAVANPAWQPWVLPVLIAYIAFALMTWIASPLFNLLLRLDKDGRHALSDEQRTAANALGICLALTLGSLAWFFFDPASQGLSYALLFGLGLIPLSAIWRCQTGWPRTLMLLFTAAFFTSGLLVRLPLPDLVLAPIALIHLAAIYTGPLLANGLQLARVTK